MAFLSHAVRDSRMQSLQAIMDRHQLDAIAVLTPDNFSFFANYFLDVQPWERPVILVMPRAGSPFAVMHELSTNHIAMARQRDTLWVSDITLYAEHQPPPEGISLRSHWPELVAIKLSAHQLADARIGVDARPDVMMQAAALLSGLEVVAIENDLRELRWVKTAEEQRLMRLAASLSDYGQALYREAIRAGRFVQELDFFVASRLAEEACQRFPGEQVELRVTSLRGPDSAAPHGNGAQTGAKINYGDVIVNIIIVRLNGLVVENERTWFCGQPSALQVSAYDAAHRAQQAAISQMVQGQTVCSIDEAALEVLRKAGYEKNVIHRTGHGVGTSGHEFPEDMAFNHRPLLAGEVYSAEPGVYVPGLGGFRHDDTVIVGIDAPEVLTKASKDLHTQVVLG